MEPYRTCTNYDNKFLNAWGSHEINKSTQKQQQVRIESTSPFINNMVTSESYMMGDGGDGGRFGKVADDIFNDFDEELRALS